MSNTKKRIVIADSKRFFAIVIAFVLVVAAVCVVIIKPWADPVEKQIEKQLNQNVSVIRCYIVAQDASGTDITDNTVYNTLNETDIVKYCVIYNYQTENGTVANYTVTDGIKISVSDTAYATINPDASIVIPNGLTSDYELGVSVKYKKLTSEFKYTIKANVVNEQDTTN